MYEQVWAGQLQGWEVRQKAKRLEKIKEVSQTQVGRVSERLPTTALESLRHEPIESDGFLQRLPSWCLWGLNLAQDRGQVSLVVGSLRLLVPPELCPFNTEHPGSRPEFLSELRSCIVFNAR